MELILAVVTGIALTLTVVMAVMLARMVREERRRADARVALLQDLAAEPSSIEAPRVRRAPKAASRAAYARPIVPASPPSTVDDLELHPSLSHASARADIFQPETESSPWPKRLAAAAAMALTVALATFLWTGNSGRQPAAQPSATASFKPLELVSLEHVQENGTLTITGLVQNPRSGVALTGVEATVLVYDRSGATLANGRAPIDIRVLAPGDESPFVMRIPVSGTVARYRIGFRGPGDRVLGHLDRRTTASVARRTDP